MNAAEFMVAIDAAKKYGLIEWAGEVNVDRCVEILARGRKRGFVPLPFEQLAEIYVEPAEVSNADPPRSSAAITVPPGARTEPC